VSAALIDTYRGVRLHAPGRVWAAHRWILALSTALRVGQRVPL